MGAMWCYVTKMAWLSSHLDGAVLAIYLGVILSPIRAKYEFLLKKEIVTFYYNWVPNVLENYRRNN